MTKLTKTLKKDLEKSRQVNPDMYEPKLTKAQEPVIANRVVWSEPKLSKSAEKRFDEEYRTPRRSAIKGWIMVQKKDVQQYLADELSRQEGKDKQLIEVAIEMLRDTDKRACFKVADKLEEGIKNG